MINLANYFLAALRQKKSDLPKVRLNLKGNYVRPRKIARICKALSVPTRVRILEILKVSTLCVNALAQELGMTAAAVSQHLRILRDADLIRPEKREYFVHYVLDWKTVERWRTIIHNLLSPPLGQISKHTTSSPIKTLRTKRMALSALL